jgi:hypothetical protein
VGHSAVPKNSHKGDKIGICTDMSDYTFDAPLRAGRSVWYDRRLRKLKPTVSALPFAVPNVDWKAFRRFLKDRCFERVIDDRVRYAQKYGSCLSNCAFSIRETSCFSDF